MSIIITSETKVLTGHGSIELVENSYVEFRPYSHMPNPQIIYLKEDVEGFKLITKGKKYPMISYLEKMDKMDADCEQFILKNIPNYFTIQAVVTSSKWTINIFNLLLSFKSFPVPTRLFSTEKEALEWIAKK